MSIAIKGVNMPENCIECPCYRRDSLENGIVYQCNVTRGVRRNTHGRPKWCPLIEVPDGVIENINVVEYLLKQLESEEDDLK